MAIKLNKKKTAKKAAGRKVTAKDSKKAGNVLNAKTDDKKEAKKTAEKNKTEGAFNANIKKEEKKTVEKKETKAKPFLERVTFAADLILEQKFTDEDIKEKVDSKYPDYPGSPAQFTQKEMGRTRWMLRNGKLSTRTLEEGRPFGRLFEHPETKKMVERGELPKKKSVSKKKVTKEEDPLNNVAGINVHDDKDSEKPVTDAVRKTTKKETKAEALKKKIKKTKK